MSRKPFPTQDFGATTSTPSVPASSLQDSLAPNTASKAPTVNAVNAGLATKETPAGAQAKADAAQAASAPLVHTHNVVSGITISGTPSAGQVLKATGPTAAGWAADDTGGGGGGGANLTYTPSPTGGTVSSDSGTDAAITLSDGVNAGLMSPAQHGKLAGLATVATSGAYADITGKPSLATVATSGAYADLSGKPALATVATSGAYADLSGKPSLAAVALSGAYTDITGRPTLAAVATSGAYGDLSGRPTLGTAAALNVPSTGDAATGQVVKGDDSRLMSTIMTVLDITQGGVEATPARVSAATIKDGVRTIAPPKATLVTLGSDLTLTVDHDNATLYNGTTTSRQITVPTGLGAGYEGVLVTGPCTVVGSGVTVDDRRVSGAGYDHCSIVQIAAGAWRVTGVKA